MTIFAMYGSWRIDNTKSGKEIELNQSGNMFMVNHFYSTQCENKM